MIAALLNEPNSDSTWNIWSLHHQQDHVEIAQALQAAGKGRFITYPLDPIPAGDKTQWLEWHQIMHRQMTDAVRSRGVDLQDVDLSTADQRKGWLWLNYLEHRTVRGALRI